MARLWRFLRISIIGRLMNIESLPVFLSNPNGDKDHFIWRLNSKGTFTMKTFYIHLIKKNGTNMQQPAELIWKVKAPSIVAFFNWEAARECIFA